ncbi:enoyl-CoA hydratase family protein [Gordonia desulfuricans]|uniref:Enoyl-CoA hydratase family protein n=1 Tax=Gordonia desulfuricans TaxID=89051 RepID=A0A7K3LT27_9ACTN|nr:enoyl-CoA hydratase family protein [Gordonia desulfuricans]NDK91372.1 enoyl-CoA hydratase family protein [Gordonia desulfuricans]
MTETSPEVVHATTVNGITTITLDSPSNRNALGEELVGRLLSALRAAGAAPDVRAVVLTHAGSTFCAGADLGEALRRGASVEEASAAGTEAMLQVMRTILELPKPVVARIDGHVRAGGFGLIGAADIVVAGPSSTFALTEARLGLAPAMISVVLLPKMTARSSGRYYLTGETFDPATAEQIGLLTRACATADDLDTEVAAILAGIGKASPQGLAASKRLTTASILRDFDRDARLRAEESAALFGSDEAREGMAAFLGKRPPAWDLSGRSETA